MRTDDPVEPDRAVTMILSAIDEAGYDVIERPWGYLIALPIEEVGG